MAEKTKSDLQIVTLPAQGSAVTPSLSVIIPAYNAAHFLRQSLQTLALSTFRNFECIVVDDGSTDDSMAVAESFGARVLSTLGRRGPGAARNMGARATRAEILLFLDSDVCVHPETLDRVANSFERDPDLSAVMGAYDDEPGEPGFLSKYRNLMHAFFHWTGRKEASTFWSGCGAIRRDVFFEHRGFDSDYDRPCIEDIELGYRLKSGGRKLMLDSDIQVKHLKRWTFLGMIKTDVFDRAIPWAELIFKSGHMPDDLNTKTGQRLSVVAVGLLFAALAVNTFRHGPWFLFSILLVVAAMLSGFWVDQAARDRASRVFFGWSLAFFSLLAVGYSTGRHRLVLALLAGYLLLLLRRLFMQHHYVWRRITGAILGGYLAWMVVYFLASIPLEPATVILFLLVGLVSVLNWQFYYFLGKHWGWFYAAAAFPFQVLYYFYSGVSFAVAAARHFLRPAHARH